MRRQRSTHGSRGIARYRLATAARELGPDHPATRAALGRLLFHQGAVPQYGSRTIESIAWHRESGACPGWLNRRERAHEAARAVSA